MLLLSLRSRSAAQTSEILVVRKMRCLHTYNSVPPKNSTVSLKVKVVAPIVLDLEPGRLLSSPNDSSDEANCSIAIINKFSNEVILTNNPS